jgi:outer membrane protein TolC
MRLCHFFTLFAAIFPAALIAETHTLTLAQAIERARAENPDVLMARLEVRKSDAGVRIQQDAFHPKVFAGSGLAYTSGFPMSIEGSAPSVVQARAVSSVYDRAQRFRIAEAKENARGAAINVEGRQQYHRALSRYRTRAPKHGPGAGSGGDRPPAARSDARPRGGRPRDRA